MNYAPVEAGKSSKNAVVAPGDMISGNSIVWQAVHRGLPVFLGSQARAVEGCRKSGA